LKIKNNTTGFIRLLYIFHQFFYSSSIGKHMTKTKLAGAHRGHDRMAVGFTTTYAISAYHH